MAFMTSFLRCAMLGPSYSSVVQAKIERVWQELITQTTHLYPTSLSSIDTYTN